MPTMQYVTWAEFDGALGAGVQRDFTVDAEGLVNMVAGWTLGVMHLYCVKPADRMQPGDLKLTGARQVAGIRED